jgi:hypothetical protein
MKNEIFNFDTMKHIEKMREYVKLKYPFFDEWTIDICFWQDGDFQIKVYHQSENENFEIKNYEVFYQKSDDSYFERIVDIKSDGYKITLSERNIDMEV